MSHETFRFNNDIFSKPQLITAAGYEAVAKYLESREGVAAQMVVEKNRNKPQRQEDGSTLLYGDTYVLDIDGTLTYRNMNTLCEVGTSYQGLKKQADYIASQPNIKTVVLSISSGGGSAHGCFAAAKYFKDTVKGAGKEIIAFVDEMACSAAYAWACISDEIIINPESEAGSIGVVIRLVDQSKALDKAGIKPMYITAGADKVPFNTDGSFKKEFLAKLQSSVDRLYTKFVNHVAANRDMSVDAIKATDANVYEAEEALQLGLVDKLMENEEFYTYLENKSKNNNPHYLSDNHTKVNMSTLNHEEELTVTEEVITAPVETPTVEATTEPVTPEANVEDTNAQLAELQAQIAQLQQESQNAAILAAETLAAAQSEAATLLADKQAAQLTAFTEQATAWASYGVDASQFAELAMANAESPLVAMMTTALDAANKSLEASAGMTELGATGEVEPEEVDAVAEKKASRSAAMKSLKK